MATKVLVLADTFTNATTITGGEVLATGATYVNRLGQTVLALNSTTGMLPASIITVPNTADANTAPLATARPVTTVDQDESGTHPLSPQYNGSNAALAAEIAAIED